MMRTATTRRGVPAQAASEWLIVPFEPLTKTSARRSRGRCRRVCRQETRLLPGAWSHVISNLDAWPRRVRARRSNVAGKARVRARQPRRSRTRTPPTVGGLLSPGPRGIGHHAPWPRVAGRAQVPSLCAMTRDKHFQKPSVGRRRGVRLEAAIGFHYANLRRPLRQTFDAGTLWMAGFTLCRTLSPRQA